MTLALIATKTSRALHGLLGLQSDWLLVLLAQAAQQAQQTVQSTGAQRALEGLIAAGPVATVLAFMCWKLWHGWQDTLRQLEAQRLENTRLQVEHVKQLGTLQTDHARQVAEQHRTHTEHVDKLNVKTLRIAVRVQRAVEALASLEAPEIEQDFMDGD